MARGRSERFFYQFFFEDGSAAVTGGFIRETEELNAQIFPTRSAVEQSSSHACPCAGKEKGISYCTVQSEQLPPAAARSNSRPSVLCGSRAELTRCVETTVGHNCAQQTGTIDTCL